MTFERVPTLDRCHEQGLLFGNLTFAALEKEFSIELKNVVRHIEVKRSRSTARRTDNSKYLGSTTEMKEDYEYEQYLNPDAGSLSSRLSSVMGTTSGALESTLIVDMRSLPEHGRTCSESYEERLLTLSIFRLIIGPWAQGPQSSRSRRRGSGRREAIRRPLVQRI